MYGLLDYWNGLLNLRYGLFYAYYALLRVRCGQLMYMIDKLPRM